MKYAVIRYLVAALVVLILGVGCAPKAPPAPVVDDLGRSVNIKGTPQRIISLSPSNTEVLFALGLGDKVVGVTEFCNYPEEAKAKPKIGGFSTVDIEKVVALEPDLIVASQIHEEEVIPALERMGLTVIGLNPKTLEDVLHDITLVGGITGKDEEASELVKNLEDRIKAVTIRLAVFSGGPNVLYLYWHDPLWTSGSGTLADEIISKAGGFNIAQDLTGHKTIELETVIYRNPQVIIVTVGHGEAGDLPYQYVLNEPRLKVTEAVMKGRVYQIDADIIQRAGPRIVEALEQVAKFTHPEAFVEEE